MCAFRICGASAFLVLTSCTAPPSGADAGNPVATAARLVDPGDWLRCTVTRTARIGTRSGDAHTEFGMIEDVHLLSDSVVAVVDRQNKVVRLFDVAGGFMAEVGREGDGPGEFRDPIEVEPWGGDRFIVLDIRAQRMSIFTVSGDYVGSFGLRPANPRLTGYLEILGEAKQVIVGATAGTAMTSIGVVAEIPYLILSYDSTGVLRDTLTESSYGSQVRWEARRVATPLFTPRGAYASDGGHLYVTNGRDPRVDVLDATGEVRDSLTWAATPEPTTEASVEAHVDERSALGQTMLALGRGHVDHAPRSPVFPSSEGLMVGGPGELWVQRYRRPGDLYETWWRFAEHGRFVCAVDFPERVKATDVRGDIAAGIYQDELGVSYVDIVTVDRPR